MGELLHDNEFWVLVGFLVFFGLLARPGWRLMAGGLDSRAKSVKSELEEARRLRGEAEALLNDYRRKQEEAIKNAADIVEAAKDEAERMRLQGEDDLKRSLAAREAQAIDRIAQAEQAALDAVRAKAAEMAIRATIGLIPEVVDQDRARALVDQAIDELPQRARA